MAAKIFMLLKEHDDMDCDFCGKTAAVQLRWYGKEQDGSYQFMFLCEDHRKSLGREIGR